MYSNTPQAVLFIIISFVLFSIIINMNNNKNFNKKNFLLRFLVILIFFSKGIVSSSVPDSLKTSSFAKKTNIKNICLNIKSFLYSIPVWLYIAITSFLLIVCILLIIYIIKYLHRRRQTNSNYSEYNSVKHNNENIIENTNNDGVVKKNKTLINEDNIFNNEKIVIKKDFIYNNNEKEAFSKNIKNKQISDINENNSENNSEYNSEDKSEKSNFFKNSDDLMDFIKEQLNNPEQDTIDCNDYKPSDEEQEYETDDDYNNFKYIFDKNFPDDKTIFIDYIFFKAIIDQYDCWDEVIVSTIKIEKINENFSNVSNNINLAITDKRITKVEIVRRDNNN
ncbi:hypothetical protein CDIK_0259 [Cucumispora dikerogammari]|nr:hypothetical protein CDIK_0259 [Cucumispora dikerogammari]